MKATEFMTKFETDCLFFYQNLKTDTVDTELKNLFGLLADSRKRHLARLEELSGSAAENGAESKLMERADHLVNGWRRSLFSQDLVKEMKNDRDAFNHIIHAEEEIIRLFEGMSRAESMDTTRKMLEMITANEKGYLKEVEEIYEFIESPHCYLEWGEFSNLRRL